MSFQDATRAAPADADFIAYKSATRGVRTIIGRRSDGIFTTIATVDDQAYAFLLLGISRCHKSLWDYDARQFDAGTVGQLAPDARAAG